MSATSARIAAMFWDCGGVLLTNGWDHHGRRRVIEHFGLNFEEFEQRHQEPNEQWERGQISLHQYLRQTVFDRPRDFTEDAFIAQMKALSKPLYPETIAWIRAQRSQQRAAGDFLECYLLSNESRELMDYRIANLGLRKPEREFFRCALDVAQQPADQCVFIDDREENVAAAREIGIHGIRMESPRQVLDQLKQLGVAAIGTGSASTNSERG
jgi:putative hydrolase of the HAD superfamily